MSKALDIPVDFGKVSIGKNTCSIPISFRSDAPGVTSDQLAHFFVGSRVNATIVADPNAGEDVEGQQTIESMSGPTITSVADCPSYRCSAKKIGVTLSFAREEISIGKFAEFACEQGRIRIERIGDAGERADDDDDDEQDLLGRDGDDPEDAREPQAAEA